MFGIIKSYFVLFFIVFILFIVVGAAFLYRNLFVSEIDKAFREDYPIYASILFVDDDKVPYAGFLMVYSPTHSRLGLISIANNMGLYTDYQKEPLSMREHYERGGLSRIYRAIEFTFHLNLTYELTINEEAIVNIVNLIGGIRLYIDDNMKFFSREQDIYIDFTEGDYFISGKKALGYSKYSVKGEDEAIRLYRLEDVILNSYIKLITTPTIQNTFSSYGFLSILNSEIKGNAKLVDLIAFSKSVKNFDENSIISDTMSGTIVSGSDALVPIVDGRYAVQHIKKLTEVVLKRREDYNIKRMDIKASVLNGTGVKGLADRINIRMRHKGFEQIEYGNFPYRKDESIVLLHSGYISKAFMLADEAKINKIFAKIDRTLIIDTTLVLGQDYYEIPR